LKIRSITCFFDPNYAVPTTIQDLTSFSRQAKAAFEGLGFEVQTTRLATTPFPTYLSGLSESAFVAAAKSYEDRAVQAGFEYISLGCAYPDTPRFSEWIPAALAATSQVFFSAQIASPQTGLSLPAVRACGDLIARAAPISADGFANLRFTALACVPANTPFFPASYHLGNQPAFALALEAADLVVEAFGQAASIAEARQSLVQKMSAGGARLTTVAEQLSASHAIAFKGLDFSPAPFPTDNCSLGAGIEGLGATLGLHGSLASAALLAEALDQGDWTYAGFNGLMLPVLEDSLLAQRSGQQLTIKDLLLYSAVCGTGLDTVPLPGDATPAQLSAVLLDVAALSLRLAKPLTARLMPVPGKQAGDPTRFDFAFFANGTVMDLPAVPLSGLLASSQESLPIRPRWSFPTRQG